MLTEFLIYDLKVAVLIAVFYVCYRLLMERDTMHHTNRVVLLTGLALSLVLPMCVITLHKTLWLEPTTVSEEAASTLATVSPVYGKASTAWPFIQALFATVVIGGMMVRLFFVMQSYRQLRRMLSNCERHKLDDGTEVAVTDEPILPFSWMRTIVVNRHDYEERNPLLLIHERSHIRLHHSWDVIFVELLTVVQWFNPVVWLLSRDLRTVHEYEADEGVLSQGFNTAQYISLLMTKATGIQAYALANGINTSEIKKRIEMMIKRKSPRLCWLKGLYVVPIAALSLAVTAKTVTDYRTLPTEEQPTALQVGETVTPDDNDPVFEVVEVMPDYPGGQAAMMEFIIKTVKYPKVAMEYGVEGRVMVQFIVEKDGSISNINAIKVDDAQGSEITVVGYKPDMTEEQKQNVDKQNKGLQALKDESIRVVKQMPKWTPGKQRSKTVRTRFSLPVTFRLK